MLRVSARVVHGAPLPSKREHRGCKLLGLAAGGQLERFHRAGDGDEVGCDHHLVDKPVRVVDRKKDMVVTGGINVYARDRVRDRRAARCARSDDNRSAQYRMGRESARFHRAGCRRLARIAEIIARCHDQLAGFKVPRSTTLIDELARNAGGKVLKDRLRSKLAN